MSLFDSFLGCAARLYWQTELEIQAGLKLAHAIAGNL
jgi:hypothetical protein